MIAAQKDRSRLIFCEVGRGSNDRLEGLMNHGLRRPRTAPDSAEKVCVSPKTYKGIGGVLVGSLLTLAGILLIVFPISATFLHPFYEGEEPVFLERVTRESSRVYGVIALVVGPGLIWIARWPRWGKRNAAIEDYVWGLSQELARRFGVKNSYAVEEVSKTARGSGYRMEHIIYAHAIFCSRNDFDAHYRARKEPLSFDKLRERVARRYFGGAREFDAANVARLARPPREEEFDLAEGAG